MTDAPKGNAKSVPITKPAKLPRDCALAKARQYGYEHVRQGKDIPRDFDLLPRKEQFAYERGRHQAILARVARPDAPLPPWPDNRHIREILIEFLGWEKADKVFQETSVGRGRAKGTAPAVELPAIVSNFSPEMLRAARRHARRTGRERRAVRRGFWS